MNHEEIIKGVEGPHAAFFVFLGLVDLFVGFALDSRSLSVAAGVRTLDADFCGDLDLAGLGVTAAAGFEAGLVGEVEAVPLD